MAVESMMSETIKSTLGAFDKRMNTIMPAILARINTLEDNDNPFLNGLNKVFGTNKKASKSVQLGDYEKGTITWDGESKKALVEVIPTYLRRIESALTGREERFFDYDEGKFVSYTRLKETFDRKATDAKISGYTALENDVMDIVRKMNLNDRDYEQFKKDFKEVWSGITGAAKE